MPYVPERGHWVWMNCDPRAGREQAGIRPALVLSPFDYNRRDGLCILCPVTNTKRGLRTQVPIPTGQAVTGVVLADHVKSVDFRARDIRYAGVAATEIVDATVAIVSSLIDPM